MGISRHPMGNYGRSRGGIGCLLLLIIVGLMGGAGVFIGSTLLGGGESAGDEALHDFETAQAILNRQTAPPNTADASASADVATSTLFPTPDLSGEVGAERLIYFPQADTAGRIVTAVRIPGGWDITYLQDLVGHLEGTSWLGETGNTVLAGHFEDQRGNPGPFRYLYSAEIGDEITIEDNRTNSFTTYVVTDVFTTDPDDVEVLRHSESPKLTLITCDNWNPERETYAERVVVIAEPSDIVQQRAPSATPIESANAFN